MAMSMTASEYFQATEPRARLAERKFDLGSEPHIGDGFEDVVGRSTALKSLRRQVEMVAPTDSTVLIQGETGTGKELIARAIHRLSERHYGPFVKLNCSAIPAGLLESELFGHERGAFTGAMSQRLGRFELADKGTLFLDEIGDLPPELQPKLLRVLQEQEFERLGGTRTIRVNVRVVAATNRNLVEMVEDQRFRSDLYYRLNIFPLAIPPLRERVEDIPLLVRHFTNQYAQRMNKRIGIIPPEVIEALAHYRWPGNVRELQNIIERAVILSHGGVLRPTLPEAQPSIESPPAKPKTLEEVERGHIIEVLRETNWVIGGPQGAAVRLGLKRTTLNYKIEKLGISRDLQ